MPRVSCRARPGAPGRCRTFAGKLVAHRTGNGLSGVSSVVTDPQGSVVGTVHNTDWASGVVRKRPDPFGGARSSTSVTSAGRGFLGAVHDSNALVLLGARYFDPAAGVFVSVDPLLDPGNPAQFNAYVYAGNNPVTWSDPSGLAWTGPVADGGDHRYVAKDKNATGKPKTKQGTGSTRSSGTTSTVISGVTITSHTAFGACGQSYNPCASRPWTAEERKFMSSAIQGTLTVIGLVPFVGEFADGLAALICLGEGDTACAALSVVAMVPGLGWGAAVGKGVKIGDDIVDATAAVTSRSIFRHVAPEELEDIAANGFRQGPNSLGGKWFAESADDAAEWGSRLNGGRGATVEVRTSSDFLSRVDRRDSLDGIGPARYVSPEQLFELNQFPRSVR